MIAEKTNTAQLIIDRISAASAKVNYVNDSVLTQALTELEQKGIPTNKHEDYKYCNLDAVIKKEFRNIEQKFNTVTTVDSHKLADTLSIVVVNGTYAPALSSAAWPAGLEIKSLSKLNSEEKKYLNAIANVESDAFIALNTAFSCDGFFLKLEKGTTIDKPVHVIHLASSVSESFINSRNLVVLEENSSLQLIEEQINLNGKTFTNYLSEKYVSEGAKLTSFTLQNEGGTGFSVNNTQAQVARNAAYDNTTITLSGHVVRNNHNVALNGENGEAHLYGLLSTKGSQLVDNHTLMDHRVPHCESNELYKGIVNDKSTGIFNGKIFVRKDAQKTNAYQSSKNILLSDDATVNTKPQLEIYANDVKCSHGTSTGKIDENAMFYLNARGIGKESARKMLLESFALEVINKIEFEPLKTKITWLFENSI